MPLIEYRILNPDGSPSGETFEELFKQKQPIPDTLYSNDGRVATRMVSVPSRTAGLWGNANWATGWDVGLGMHIENSQHRDRVLKERGLVPLSDLPKHAAQDAYQKKKEANDHWDARNDQYQGLLAAGNTPEQASVIWSSREECEKDQPFLVDSLKNTNSNGALS